MTSAPALVDMPHTDPEVMTQVSPELRGQRPCRELNITRPDGQVRHYGNVIEIPTPDGKPGGGLVQLRRRGLGKAHPVWSDNGTCYDLTWECKRQYLWREPLLCPEALERAPVELRAWIKHEWPLCREASSYERLLAEPALQGCLYHLGDCYGNGVRWA